MWPDPPRGFLADATRVAPPPLAQPPIDPRRFGALPQRTTGPSRGLPPETLPHLAYEAFADLVPGSAELRALKDSWRMMKQGRMGAAAGTALLGAVPFGRVGRVEKKLAREAAQSELKYMMPSGNEFIVRGGSPRELHADMLLEGAPAAGGETIKSAAIRMNDGRMFTGRDHFSAIEGATGAGIHPDALSEASDGFLTSTGRFVDREEAYRIHAGEAPSGGMGLMAQELLFPGAVSRPGKSEAKPLEFLGPYLKDLK